MIEIGRKQFGISSFSIRLLAVISMVIGGVAYIKGVGYDTLEAFKWTSFSFFAFLLAEGVHHSTDKVLYLRRFFVFSLLGEVLYDYMRFGRFWYWRFFSPMATLLLGLLLLFALAYIKKRFENIVLDMLSVLILGGAAYYVANRYGFSFGGYGVVIILMFYIARGVTYTKICQLAVLLYLSFYLSSNVLTTVTVGGLQYPVVNELFSMIALPFIWLYDGSRGPNSLRLQIAQYLVFPAFMGVLIFMKYFHHA